MGSGNNLKNYFSMKCKMAAESATTETNDTKKLGYEMKSTLMKHFRLFSIDEESYNVKKKKKRKKKKRKEKIFVEIQDGRQNGRL